MLEAAKQSEKKWKESVFKELPVSYVAPNNQIDSLGLVALKKGFPSLNYIHTSFAGDLEKGGNREFDPDPLNSRFFDYPRISNGYDISPAQRWDIESTYLYTGIWTHVLNHKTIFESGSSDNSLISFKNQINDFKKRHPYTRFLPAKLATEATMDWRYQSVRHLNFEGQYEVSSSINSDAMKPSYWLMYIESKNDQKLTKRLADEQVNYESVPFLNGFLYHIKTFSPSVSVPDIRPQIQNLVGTTTSVVGQTNNEYSKFNNSKETLVPLGKQIDRLIAEEKPEQASVLIENLFEDNKFINKNQIISYAQFMKQLGKKKELWNQLNELYTTNPSKNFASLAYTVSKINGFPSQETKKIWLERLLEWQSENTEILKDYYTSFNTPDNEKTITQILETLATVQPNKENIKNYLDFLMETQSDQLLPALDTIEECSLEDEELSTAISLAYADQLNFDKALLWLKCSKGIEPQIVQEWQLKSKNFEDKKVSDFPYYIEYLLVNNQERAIVEIQNIPTCRPDLKSLAKPIALLLGEYMQPKKALEWSHCAQDIPVKQLMDWNAEVGDIAQLKKVYYEHMNQNSRDYEIMNYMAQMLLLNGHTEDAGKTALSIPANKLDPDFKIAFNNEVQQETDKTRTLYINTFKILMDDAIVRKSKIQRRKQKGHSIGFTSNMWADKFDPTLVNNLFHFGFYNKNEDFHRFSISQANAYIILKDTLIANDQGRDLLGLEYKFSKESSEKNPYYLSARVEMDNFNSFYFHFNSGIDFLGENSKTSLQVNTHPVRTGPGYVLNIYDLGFMAQQSFNYTKNLKQKFTVNGSYFTDSQYYATGSSRIDYSLINLDKFSVGPLLEGSYSLGSEERRDGFPYWLTENRLFGGGGLSIQIGNEKSDFLLKTDFSLFTEQDEPNFERYHGNLSYRIKDFTQINLGYNYFTIDKFFGNTFQLGIQYNFK